MSRFTHRITEQGQGWPQDGEVIACGDDLLRVVETGPILTDDSGSTRDCHTFALCEPAGDVWDISEAEYEALRVLRVSPIGTE